MFLGPLSSGFLVWWLRYELGIIVWYNVFREVCISILESFSEKIGGPGGFVEINELEFRKEYSCTPDREFLCFTLREKFLSHPCYLTPVLFNIGCVGRHIILSLSPCVTMMSNHSNSKWRKPQL